MIPDEFVRLAETLAQAARETARRAATDPEVEIKTDGSPVTTMDRAVEAAQEGADRIIVTDDNPRREDGDAIVADIMEGFPGPGAVQVERDRGRAINRAIAGARAADVVLIAGKGHEAVQERDGARLPFSDVAQARRALEVWR